MENKATGQVETRKMERQLGVYRAHRDCQLKPNNRTGFWWILEHYDFFYRTNVGNLASMNQPHERSTLGGSVGGW